MRATAFLLVVAMTIAGCIFAGDKRGPRGTNTTVGTGSNNQGPWSGGTTAAEVDRP